MSDSNPVIIVCPLSGITYTIQGNALAVAWLPASQPHPLSKAATAQGWLSEIAIKAYKGKEQQQLNSLLAGVILAQVVGHKLLLAHKEINVAVLNARLSCLNTFDLYTAATYVVDKKGQEALQQAYSNGLRYTAEAVVDASAGKAGKDNLPAAFMRWLRGSVLCLSVTNYMDGQDPQTIGISLSQLMQPEQVSREDKEIMKTKRMTFDQLRRKLMRMKAQFPIMADKAKVMRDIKAADCQGCDRITQVMVDLYNTKVDDQFEL